MASNSSRDQASGPLPDTRSRTLQTRSKAELRTGSHFARSRRPAPVTNGDSSGLPKMGESCLAGTFATGLLYDEALLRLSVAGEGVGERLSTAGVGDGDRLSGGVVDGLTSVLLGGEGGDCCGVGSGSLPSTSSSSTSVFDFVRADLACNPDQTSSPQQLCQET